jgi:hypothetical protein
MVTTVLFALLVGATVWTSGFQRRHDSLSVLASTAAVFPAALSVPAFAVYLAQRDIWGASARPPFALGGFLALASFCAGPGLFLVAALKRRADKQAASATFLQACHFLLCAS